MKDKRVHARITTYHAAKLDGICQQLEMTPSEAIRFLIDNVEGVSAPSVSWAQKSSDGNGDALAGSPVAVVSA